MNILERIGANAQAWGLAISVWLIVGSLWLGYEAGRRSAGETVARPSAEATRLGEQHPEFASVLEGLTHQQILDSVKRIIKRREQ